MALGETRPERGQFVRAGACGTRLEPSPPRGARRQAGKEGRPGRGGGRRRKARVTIAAPGLRRASSARGPAERAPRRKGRPEARMVREARRRPDGCLPCAGGGWGGRAGGRAARRRRPCTGPGGAPLRACRFPGGWEPVPEAAGRGAEAFGTRRGGNERVPGRCGNLDPVPRRAAAKRSAAAPPPPSWAPGAVPAKRGSRGRRGLLGSKVPGSEDETAGRWPRGPGPDRVCGANPRLESWGLVVNKFGIGLGG